MGSHNDYSLVYIPNKTLAKSINTINKIYKEYYKDVSDIHSCVLYKLACSDIIRNNQIKTLHNFAYYNQDISPEHIKRIFIECPTVKYNVSDVDMDELSNFLKFTVDCYKTSIHYYEYEPMCISK